MTAHWTLSHHRPSAGPNMAAVYQYWIYFVIISSFLCRTITGEEDITFQTYAVCFIEGEMATLNFYCDNDELIIINKAFDGKQARYKASFCEYPQPDIQNDCIKYEIQEKDQLLTNCGKRKTCKIYLPFKDIPCSEDYRGNTYLAVQYACFPAFNNGTNNNYHYVPISLDRADWRLGNRALINTEQYPQWRDVMSVDGACQVFLQPGDSLVIHLLDFAGKLIYQTDGCAIQLILHDGDKWHSLCGNLTWQYRRFVMKPAKDPWRVDIILTTDMENSEGRAEMIIEGVTSSGQYVQSMNMSCGKSLRGLYTMPVTTTTTTTTTTTATSASTSLPTKTVTPILEETNLYDPAPGSSATFNSNTMVIGGIIGGIVLLIIVIVSAVCCSRRPSTNARTSSQPRTNPTSTSNGHVINGRLAEPKYKKAKGKKQPKEGNPKHYNAYITNSRQNHISPAVRHNSDEYYDEIIDGSLPTNTWMTDNRNLAVSPGRYPDHVFTVNHDPAFDEPTETTLKLAKGTTRGFNY